MALAVLYIGFEYRGILGLEFTTDGFDILDDSDCQSIVGIIECASCG